MSGFLDTLKNLVSGAAPLIANTLLPGSGGLAKTLIGKVFGVDPGDEAGLVQAMQNATPDQIMALKQAEMTHETELVRINADLDKAFLADRQGAREAANARLKAGGSNTRANWMIIGDVVGLLGCLATLFLAELGESERAIIITFGSYFGLGLRDAHQFEFGSSRGSKDKTLQLSGRVTE